MQKVVLPFRLARLYSARCLRNMSAISISPSPRPLFLVEKKGVKTFAAESDDRPGPSSSISMLLSAVRNVMRPFVP